MKMTDRGFSEDLKRYNGYLIDELQEVFSRIQNEENWKLPISCKCHHSNVGIILAAIEFFHADKAEIIGIENITGSVLIEGDGYQAW